MKRVLLAALLAATATCADVDSPVPNDGIQVRIGDFFYSPDTVTVAVGTVVRWTNDGNVQHRVASDAALWESPLLPRTFWFEVRFDSAGTYNYHCLADAGHDEVGTVIVR
jgi:plastocyanin